MRRGVDWPAVIRDRRQPRPAVRSPGPSRLGAAGPARPRSRAVAAVLARALVLTLVLVGGAGPSAAWGPTGHRTVGRIAENHLSLEAARAVDDLIGPDTLAEVGVWADFIRSDPAWRHADPWHYINLEDGQTLATAPRHPDGDILVALHRFTGVVRDAGASREEKSVALKFLVHLTGDAHQPLHAGRASDRGGNTIEVLWHGQPADLHGVWDSLMIDSQRLSFSELAAFLDAATLTEIRAWQAASFEEWIAESIAYRAAAYEVGNGELGYAYTFRHLPMVERRLLQAGIRLAGLLNGIFAAPLPAPAPADAALPDVHE